MKKQNIVNIIGIAIIGGLFLTHNFIHHSEDEKLSIYNSIDTSVNFTRLGSDKGLYQIDGILQTPPLLTGITFTDGSYADLRFVTGSREFFRTVDFAQEEMIFNEGAKDVDFTFKSDNTPGDDGILFIEGAGEGKIGFFTGTSSPTESFTVGTNALFSGSQSITVTIDHVLKLVPQSAAPTSPAAGMLYYDSDDNKLKLYNGSTWVDLN